MKPSIRVLCTAALLPFVNITVWAQQSAAPDAAVADAPVQTEMQKWIATTDAQWQATFKRDVADVREAEAKKLMLQYLNMLEDGIAKASKAGDLKGALALRDEQKRFGDTQVFPEKEDAADTAPALKESRTAIHARIAKLVTDAAVRAKALHAKYDQVLAQAQTQLTQRQRLDDALLVQKKREEVAAAWLAGPNAATATIETPKSPAVTPPRVIPARPTAPVENERTILQSQLSNTQWRMTEDTQKTFTLHPDGTTTSNWNPRTGSWKVTGAHTLDLSVTNVHTIQKAKLNPEHTEIKMANAIPGAAPTTWTLIKK